MDEFWHSPLSAKEHEWLLNWFLFVCHRAKTNFLVYYSETPKLNKLEGVIEFQIREDAKDSRLQIPDSRLGVLGSFLGISGASGVRVWEQTNLGLPAQQHYPMHMWSATHEVSGQRMRAISHGTMDTRLGQVGTITQTFLFAFCKTNIYLPWG